MSVIRKQPYIEEVLNSIFANSDNITNFGKVLNGTDTGNVFKTLVGSEKLTNADKGVKAVNMELALGNVKSGILCYNDNYCVLIAYHRFQDVAIFKLDIANCSFEKVNEECSIEELRRVYDDLGSERAGDEWVETMKDKMVYDSEDNEIQVGTHLYVDGKLEIGDTGGSAGDLVVGHEIIIDDLQKIVNTNGDAFIPDPSGHLNEALVHTTTGYAWKKITDMGSIQLVAKAVFEGGEFVTHTNIIYVVYDTDGSCYIKYYTA